MEDSVKTKKLDSSDHRIFFTNKHCLKNEPDWTLGRGKWSEQGFYTKVCYDLHLSPRNLIHDHYSTPKITQTCINLLIVDTCTYISLYTLFSHKMNCWNHANLNQKRPLATTCIIVNIHKNVVPHPSLFSGRSCVWDCCRYLLVEQVSYYNKTWHYVCSDVLAYYKCLIFSLTNKLIMISLAVL